MSARSPGSFLRGALVAAAVAAAAGLACRPGFDDSRESVDTGTFGETVVTLVCKRIAYLDDLADGGTTDVRGDNVRDLCRAGGPAPDTASGSLQALEATRPELVASVDTIFPDADLASLQAFLTSNDFLAVTDDGTTEASIDALVAALRSLAGDDAAMAAMGRLAPRLGYRPSEPALGTMRALVRYPQLNDLILQLTTAITEGGGAHGEWDHLLAALGAAMRNARPLANQATADRPLRVALDLLLKERAELAPSNAMPLTSRDARGLATVAGSAGSMPAPFVDHNADGQADTDADGHFVDGNGAPIDAPAPFAIPGGDGWPARDASGRALTPAGQLVYRYVDLDRTVLGALARDGLSLFDPVKQTGFDLLRGASAMMGPRVAATHTYEDGETLDYRGYKTEEPQGAGMISDAPLLDLAQGFLQMARDPDILDVTALARRLLQQNQPELARLTEAIITAARKGDDHPEAQILPNAPLWDDLNPLLVQVLARPALVNALMAAMELPSTAQLGDRFRKYMTYKDRFDINPQTQAVVGAFATMVDRTRPDSGFDRSIFQRFLNLINDSNGAVACNKQGARVVDPFLGITLGTYDRCALFRVNNLAVFYMQSIAYAKTANGLYVCEDDGGAFDSTTTATTPQGCTAQGRRPQPKANFNYQWGGLVSSSIDLFGGDGFLEDTVGIVGMRTHPTPQALDRVLFLDPTPSYLTNIIDPLVDRDGDSYKAQHAGTLPVLEVEGFYDEMRPIIQAFADQGQEQLLVDILSVLHKHWPTKMSINTQSVNPAGANYAFGSGGRTWEPLIADVLQDGQLLGALTATAPTLDRIVVNGKTYQEIVRAAARFFLEPQAGFVDRLGHTTTTTSDGRTVPFESPWYILADAYQRKKARLADAGPEGQAWTDSTSELVDIFMRGVAVGGAWRFRNPRTVGVALGLLDLVDGRLNAHVPDRGFWLTTTLPADLEDTMTGPVFAGLADFVLALSAEPATRDQLVSLVRYLQDEASDRDSFVTALTGIADTLQLALDDRDLVPIVNALGEIIKPEHGWVAAQLELVKRARAADTGGALSRLMVHLYDEPQPGESAVGDLVDGLSEIHRTHPFADLGKDMTAEDYRSALTGVADFLSEQRRGLPKFIAIIKSRNLSQ
ncbi:MAG TPA: hypothetical protein VHE35_02525 [Kofleriaceae bacterium]|nr:hypothetical protein [Kofleriaceae bacterium]